MRVGIIADTHISDRRRSIPSAVWRAFEQCDCILHAGDVSRKEVLDELSLLAPVHAVHGNVDAPELLRSLPATRVLDLNGVVIGLTHGHLGRGRSTRERALGLFDGVNGLAAVVFGHSHEPCNELAGNVLQFNPGSPTERRRQARHSCGLLRISDGDVRGEIVISSGDLRLRRWPCYDGC